MHETVHSGLWVGGIWNNITYSWKWCCRKIVKPLRWSSHCAYVLTSTQTGACAYLIQRRETWKPRQPNGIATRTRVKAAHAQVCTWSCLCTVRVRVKSPSKRCWKCLLLHMQIPGFIDQNSKQGNSNCFYSCIVHGEQCSGAQQTSSCAHTQKSHAHTTGL